MLLLPMGFLLVEHNRLSDCLQKFIWESFGSHAVEVFFLVLNTYIQLYISRQNFKGHFPHMLHRIIEATAFNLWHIGYISHQYIYKYL